MSAKPDERTGSKGSPLICSQPSRGKDLRPGHDCISSAMRGDRPITLAAAEHLRQDSMPRGRVPCLMTMATPERVAIVRQPTSPRSHGPNRGGTTHAS